MTDDERTALVQRNIENSKERWAKETKFCAACGCSMLGGVSGDRTVLGCVQCGERSPRYRVRFLPEIEAGTLRF